MDFLIEPFFVASPYRARVRSAHARRFAAPLLCQGGEFALFQVIHTLIDRAYSIAAVRSCFGKVRAICRGMTNRGYSLIETLLATILLVSGIIHLATLFSFSEGIRFRNRQRTAAVLLVYNKMEELRQSVPQLGGGLDALHPVPGFFDSIDIDVDGTVTVSNSDSQRAYLRMWQVQPSETPLVTIVVYARIGSSRPLELARASAFRARH